MRFLLLTLIALPALFAQATPPAAAPARRNGPPTQPAYAVNDDRTVTFTLRAPDATNIRVSGDFLTAPQDLKKSPEGIWTLTVGPLAPAIYSYSLSINGVHAIDPNNPMVQLGDRASSSMFEVPGDKPAVYDIQPVPHGTVHLNWYESKTVGALRGMAVYTPPGYEAGRNRLPVLYLLHGSGDTELAWMLVGRANLILDNLIAQGKAKPMIVVMPYGRPTGEVMLIPAAPAQSTPAPNPHEVFGKDLIDDVIPAVEKLYRVSARPDARAIAGLSMGGQQTLLTGLSHLDTFHYIGAFSAGERGNPEDVYKSFLADSATANKKLKLLYMAVGKTDSLFAPNQKIDEALTAHGVEHMFLPSEEGHVWRNWRAYLADFTSRIFTK